MDVRVGLKRKLSTTFWWRFWTMVLDKTLEINLGCTEIKLVNIKGNQSWIFIGRTDTEELTLATWCEELTHWKRPCCWERLKVGGEGDDRGWDGWKALLTQRTWVWASSESWWWTGKPGVLQSMGSQRFRHEWANTHASFSIQDRFVRKYYSGLSKTGDV